MYEEWLIVFMPLGMFGIWNLMNMLMVKMKVRKGFFRVIFRMPNHRKIIKFIKPEKTYFKQKDNIYPFSDDVGFIYYNGTVPEIEYDIHGNQINFVKKDLTATIDPKGLSSLYQRAYNLGKKSSKKKDDLGMIFSMVAAGSSVLTLLLLFSFIQG